MIRRAVVVVDLGFGDAGKGRITDALVRKLGASLVVRFNGGAQAGHNVVTEDGRHHTFSQWGAGSFVPGVRTHLARQVIVHPGALFVEAQVLESKGVKAPLQRLSISPEARVITPFHQALNRLRELQRGEARHGSCGVGVGEVAAEGRLALRLGDLFDRTSARPRLAQIQAEKRAIALAWGPEMGREPSAASELAVLEDPSAADRWLDSTQRLFGEICLIDDEEVALPSATVFEGAQGVLLDEWFGFHPYTTWSTCTFRGAQEFLEAQRFDGHCERLGVLRSYCVRHGPGPLPTEQPHLAPLLPEPHNTAGPWQGSFRRGWPDAVLGRYAARVCGGVDGLWLTHLDALARVPEWRLATSYHSMGEHWSELPEAPTSDLAELTHRTELLQQVEPEYVLLPQEQGPAAVAQALAESYGIPLYATSSGLGDRDVEFRK